ncbi:aldehyde dehydrogenase family protein [Acidocella aminolytica]|uniref:Aldehyde/betaine dehydrogenase n=1 Tax=Acidocella aminolytica 101 = DSM 11237 TaxID=1120923 RepID=A0A0D6PF29_9PROT|nr:aldehyde dehydrogenase family protein [Acidocella aminolytica]GAN80355.1 aldehyde/betaine dehydrogenase [Acidocella aminolytica 101 = DSM 11237]GBQ42925.1 hypothetical protein AA11237_3114 [Acidocella aminolytica 101 = DSM 11237]SHE29475.1 Aldehyde dehydrogenase family protein [Acidocella aminolytica 101 = DSM 11237]
MTISCSSLRSGQKPVQSANYAKFGLSSEVYADGEALGLSFALHIEAGITHINDISPNEDPNIMFGGAKNGGIDRFNSNWIIGNWPPVIGSACTGTS